MVSTCPQLHPQNAPCSSPLVSEAVPWIQLGAQRFPRFLAALLRGITPLLTFLSPCPGCLSQHRSFPCCLVLSRENPLRFPHGIRMLDTCLSPCCFWRLDALTCWTPPRFALILLPRGCFRAENGDFSPLCKPCPELVCCRQKPHRLRC